MADLRGRYSRYKLYKKKNKKPVGRPKGARMLFKYEESELANLPADARFLSPCEIKILKGLMDPEIQELSSDVEKCKKMGVSRSKYYSALRDPRFLKIFNEQSLAIVRAESISLLRSSLKFAKQKASNHRDRAMLFQMLGFINNDGVDININLEQKKENPFEHMTLDELKALAKGYMKNDFVDTEFKEVGGNE